LGTVVFKGENEQELNPASGMLKDAGYQDKVDRKEETVYYRLKCYFADGNNLSSEIIKVEVNTK
jgi:hypothetical protein